MNREHRLRKHLLGAADDAFQHQLVRVAAGALADLNDERGLAGEAAPEQTHALLQIVDVIGANRVLAVSGLEQLLRGHNHRRIPPVAGP